MLVLKAKILLLKGVVFFKKFCIQNFLKNTTPKTAAYACTAMVAVKFAVTAQILKFLKN